MCEVWFWGGFLFFVVDFCFASWVGMLRAEQLQGLECSQSLKMLHMCLKEPVWFVQLTGLRPKVSGLWESGCYPPTQVCSLQPGALPASSDSVHFRPQTRDCCIRENRPPPAPGKRALPFSPSLSLSSLQAPLFFDS